MYSIPNPFSSNIRQSNEKKERLKEERDTVEYERKAGRLDYAGDICLLAQRFCDMDEKLKRLKEKAELAGLHTTYLMPQKHGY